jgi:hypothetical protein
MDPQTGRITRKRARSLRERAAPLFGIFSDELLLEIFSTLTPEDLASCVSVSHAWRLLAGDGVLWRHHVANEHGRERPPVPSLKAPSAARQLFGELRLAARAALLLGELDYVGFYEETLPGIPDGTIPDGTHTLAFWLRAWPARLSSSDKEAMLMRFADPTVATHTVGLEVLTNYVYLNPPPVPPPGVHSLGQWGGEAYRAMWRDELVDGAPAGRVLRSFRSQLVPGDGPGAAPDVMQILGITPRFELQLSASGHRISALPTFAGNGFNVRMFGMLRAGSDPFDLLRALRPAADLTGLPPGDAWRPKRRNLAATDGVLGVISDAGWALARAFSGFDTWPGPSRRSARLEAALDRWRHPMDQDEPPPASSADTSAA